MTQEQVDLDTAIITGMILIADLPTHSLIDSGATQSFISVAFAAKLGVTPDIILMGYSVSLPSGEVLLSTSIIGTCKIRMQNHVRTITLKPSKADLFVFYATPSFNLPYVISACKARRLLSKGCESLIANIIEDSQLPRPKLNDMEVARDFQDVFPDDIVGLPPAREVEFGIELVPGATPGTV
ncbi:uncharacterized protein [Henckelia pumila]|uniref:uncharacterized protein n=1 Tax=Henckelia pumila TaxID=405737 RepID=UPI003C6E6C77